VSSFVERCRTIEDSTAYFFRLPPPPRPYPTVYVVPTPWSSGGCRPDLPRYRRRPYPSRPLPPLCWMHEETPALIEADKVGGAQEGEPMGGGRRTKTWSPARHRPMREVLHRRLQVRRPALRKRYGAERSRSMGRSKGPKWPFFPLLHDLPGGGAPDPSPNPSPRSSLGGTPPVQPLRLLPLSGPLRPMTSGRAGACSA
jgi:hypothetical protein